jgi:hypothetical protein
VWESAIGDVGNYMHTSCRAYDSAHIHIHMYVNYTDTHTHFAPVGYLHRGADADGWHQHLLEEQVFCALVFAGQVLCVCMCVCVLRGYVTLLLCLNRVNPPLQEVVRDRHVVTPINTHRTSSHTNKHFLSRTHTSRGKSGLVIALTRLSTVSAFRSSVMRMRLSLSVRVCGGGGGVRIRM